MITSAPVPLQEARPLGYFVEHLADLPAWQWLYVRADVAEVLLSTLCYAQAFDSRDLSDDEMDAFEAKIEAAGFRSFLNRDQIEEIVANLEQQQQSAPTAQEVAGAIAYYWAHDAFIARSGDAA